MRVTLYTANCKGHKKNCIYPNRCVIEDEVDFMAAVGYDHVCAWFDKSYRSTDNFRTSDVDVMDCDNNHSDNPDDWIYPENYEKLFPDVSYIVVPSRNNMKVKEGRSARPRHHVYFPHDPIDTADASAALKIAIHQKFPFFDSNALDAARFIYGFSCEEIVWHEGEITIDCLLKPSMSAIPQGQRNSTMSRFAGRVVKRYGATDHAYQIFMEEAAKCDPPLEDEELQLIWGSASKFAARVQSQEGYVAPDDFAHESLKLSDYSDIGQAKIVSREYGDELRFTDATDYLRYNGEYWVESKQRAVGAMEEFLDLQLQDALDEVKNAMDALLASGADVAWCCSRHIETVEACSMKYITDDALKTAFLTMMNKLVFSQHTMLRPLLNALKGTNDKERLLQIEELENKLDKNAEQRQVLIGLMASGYLEPALFNKESNALTTEAEMLRQKKDSLMHSMSGDCSKVDKLEALIQFTKKNDMATEYADELFLTFVDRVIVLSRTEVTFEMKCGLNLEERLVD